MVDVNGKVLDEFENAILTNTDRTVSGYHRGDVIHVKIVKIDQDCLLVDVGRKSEIFIPIEDVIHDPNLPLAEQYKVGQEIPVKVVRDEKSKGGIYLSQKKAMFQTQVDAIEKAFQDQTPLKGKVKERVKGGFIVDMNGIQAFLPNSLTIYTRDFDVDAFLGSTIDIMIVEFDNMRRKLVVSHKVLEDLELAKKREEFVSKLEVNQLVEGVVTNIVAYGAFLDIGFNFEGLVHVSELSWSNTKSVSEVLTKGQTIKVRVIGITDDRKKVSLSLKRTLADPWESLLGKYNLGDIVEGIVIRDLGFGAIIELDKGVNAFMHISQISNKHISSIDEVIQIGEPVKAEIVEIDLAQKKIKLSRRSLLPREEYNPETNQNENNNSNEEPTVKKTEDDFSSFVDVFVPKKAD
jgi:ribosomal protein S1